MKFRPAATLALVLLPALVRSEVIERVFVRVGGEIITMSDFTNRQVAAAQAARIPPDKVDAYLRENNAKILQDAIDELLLVRRASDLGLKLRPDYVDEVIEGIKKDNKIDNEEDFNARLRGEGMTLADLKRNIERSILRQQVIRKELEPTIAVSDADARAAYESRKADFTTPATIHLQEILVAPASPAGLAKAREIAAAVRGGQDFAEQAKRNSGSPTAALGGELGELTAADLAPVLAREAAKLKPGEISEPFVDGGGYRIVRVVSRKPEVVRPFEEARQDVVNQLMRPKYDEQYEKYMAGLREAAKPETQVMVREVPTEVTLSGEGSILSGTEADTAAPGGAPGASTSKAPAAPADPDAEISTTGSAKPQRIAPEETVPAAPATAPAPAAPKPSPTPTPRPTPTPSPTPPAQR